MISAEYVLYGAGFATGFLTCGLLIAVAAMDRWYR